MSQELASAVDAIERELFLLRFDHDDAWWLGSWLRARGKTLGAALSIEVSRGDVIVFRHLMPGATRNNVEWMRRKIALSARFERSSYAVGLAHQDNPGWFERAGLVWEEFSPAGGAVPIRVAGTGMVGTLCVSGLTQEEDHDLAIEALRALGLDREHAGGSMMTQGGGRSGPAT